MGVFFWLRGQDSNLGPRGYEPRELPLLHPAILVIELGYYSKVTSVGQFLLRLLLAVHKEIKPGLRVTTMRCFCDRHVRLGGCWRGVD